MTKNKIIIEALGKMDLEFAIKAVAAALPLLEDGVCTLRTNTDDKIVIGTFPNKKSIRAVVYYEKEFNNESNT